MIVIQVCVGSSCHLRGAPEVISTFQRLIASAPADAVELKGCFCMERCADGVSLKIGDRVFSGVHPADVPRLFDEYVRPGIAAAGGQRTDKE